MSTKTAGRGAVQQVVAGKDAQLELRIKGSHPDGTACEFQVYKATDQSLLDTIDGQLQKGKATTKWAAKGPDAAGTARSHRVYYVVTVNNTEKTTSPELEVYHDWVQVTSKGEDDAALADMRFVVTVKAGGFGKEFKGNTGSSGTFKVDNLPPGDVEVTWASPARLVEWTEGTATRRTAKLKKAFKATLLWPTAGTHEQWVNHKAKPGQPDWGSKLKVRIGVHPDDGPSKRGDEVFVKLEYPPADQLSKRTTPARGAKGATAAPWCTPMLGLKKQVERDGGEVEVEVELGLAGGDKVKIHVGGTEACDDEVVEVTNWRRIYYQLTRPDSMAVHDMARVDERMQACFVVYERFKEVTFTRDEAPPEVKGSWLLGSELGLTDDRKDKYLLIAGDHNATWFRKKFDTSKGKLGIDLTLCDEQFDAGETKKTRVTSRIVPVMTAAEQDVMLDDDKVAFPVSLTDGGHPFISGTWEAVNPPKGKKLKGKLTKDALKVDKMTRTVKVVLPKTKKDDPGNIVGDGTGGTYKIRCTIKLQAAFGPFNGWSDGAHLMVVLGTDAQVFNDVVMHEVGHSMKQAASGYNAPPKGLTLADHDHLYDEHGHSGDHCNYGFDDAGATHVMQFLADGGVEFVDIVGAASEQADYGLVKKKVGTEYRSVYGTCVMFGGSGEGWAPTGFCEHCLPFIKAQSLEDVTK